MIPDMFFEKLIFDLVHTSLITSFTLGKKKSQDRLGKLGGDPMKT